MVGLVSDPHDLLLRSGSVVSLTGFLTLAATGQVGVWVAPAWIPSSAMRLEGGYIAIETESTCDNLGENQFVDVVGTWQEDHRVHAEMIRSSSRGPVTPNYQTVREPTSGVSAVDPISILEAVAQKSGRLILATGGSATALRAQVLHVSQSLADWLPTLRGVALDLHVSVRPIF